TAGNQGQLLVAQPQGGGGAQYPAVVLELQLAAQLLVPGGVHRAAVDPTACQGVAAASPVSLDSAVQRLGRRCGPSQRSPPVFQHMTNRQAGFGLVFQVDDPFAAERL